MMIMNSATDMGEGCVCRYHLGWCADVPGMVLAIGMLWMQLEFNVWQQRGELDTWIAGWLTPTCAEQALVCTLFILPFTSR